ncbi:hypothetical protein H0H92_001589 [Tricholoma furcatifolium]|nr:hypothetical protein H0H92_001589 [Tricholoma furcatifolium]
MAKRKGGSEDSAGPASPERKKRSRQQLPIFRSINHSRQRSMVLHTRPNGRLGQRRKDKDVANSTDELAKIDTNSEPPGPLEDETADTASSTIPLQDKPKRKRMRNNTMADHLNKWLNFRESSLRELLRHEGLANSTEDRKCISCHGIDSGIFQCKDCLTREFYCSDCIVKTHVNVPLHRLQRWNGKFFESSSLYDLGLRVQLGHDGGPCVLPEKGPSEFIILDLNGAHRVSIDYCGCSPSLLHKRTQILRAQWFPATQDRPRTAFTFSCLKFFHELTLQGKTTVYDFFKTLMRRTDNCQLGEMLCRYQEFHRSFRIWRHLQMLKRGGRAHDVHGASGTSLGELAVDCPACPHPGRNLPENWEEAPPIIRWLYTLFLAIDANFKLRLKNRGLSDTELAPGWAYYVEDSAYQVHLKNYIDQPEINTCQSEHDAIARANTRHLPGHLVSGTGLILCARHALIRRNAVADLTKGENQVIYAGRQILHHGLYCSDDTGSVISLWGKNLQTRAADYPDNLTAAANRIEWTALVPRWHIRAHGEECQTEHSLNYEQGVGRTCGEDVECGWSHTNQLSTSTREMGPANRRETLDDHWGGWNWQKIVGFRSLFRKRLQEAVVMREKHRTIFAKLTKTFSTEKIEEWSQMIEEWRIDRRKPRKEWTKDNPYAEPTKVANLQDVKRELAKEEAEQAAGGVLPLHDKIGPTEFISRGLELENQQCALSAELKGLKATKTPKQLADIQLKRTALQTRILHWRQAQMIYMPFVIALLASADGLTVPNDSDSLALQPEELPLHLPSSLSPKLRETIPSLAKKEERLRLAQADDSLAEIRRHRRILTGLYQFKKFNVSGTGNRPNTRMYGLFKSFNTRIDRFAAKYRSSYQALSCLDPSGPWKIRFQKLEPGDIRGPGKEDSDVSNGRFEPSWIWLVPRLPTETVLDTEQQLEDSMRIDWAKAKARLSRWEEEVELVQEEMRRVIQYLAWRAAWWRSRGEGSEAVTNDKSFRSGLEGYAERQANLLDQLAVSSAACWLPMLQRMGIEPAWGTRFVVVHTTDVCTDATEKELVGENVEEWNDEEDTASNEDEEGLGVEIEDFQFFDDDM